MKLNFPLNWLLEYLDTDRSAEEIAEKMTKIGIEVESCIRSKEAISDSQFRIAEITAIQPHPSAQSLRICTVDGGLQIVCGAPNVRVGMRSILAILGAIIPISGQIIKAVKLRGVESQGMLCSKEELLLADKTDGIIDVDLDYPKLNEHQILEQIVMSNGPLFSVSVTPERPDLMSIYGIACELARFGFGKLKKLKECNAKTNAQNTLISIDASVSSVLSMYAVDAVLSDQVSPVWLKRRLFDSDLGHKDFISDVSSYILHAFGQKIEMVEIANDSKLAVNHHHSIDFNDQKFEDVDCLIDNASVVAVLGRAPSLALHGRALIYAAIYSEDIMRSNYSKSFRRITDPSISKKALEQACILLLGYGSTELPDIVEVKKLSTQQRPSIRMPNTTFIHEDIDPDEILQNLGFIKLENGEYSPPAFRTEPMQNDADLLHEILRWTGFDNVEAKFFWSPHIIEDDAKFDSLAAFLSKLGMFEIMSPGFMSKKMSAIFKPDEQFIIANPMKPDKQYALRNTALGSIIETVGLYFRNNWIVSGIFEIGRVYKEGTESEVLALAIWPDNFYEWYSNTEPYFRAKEIFESCLRDMPFVDEFVQSSDKDGVLSNGCVWTFEGVKVAEFGQLNTKLFSYIFPPSKSYKPVYLGEIDVEKIKLLTSAKDLSKDLPDYCPSEAVIERDISFFIPESISFAEAVLGVREHISKIQHSGIFKSCSQSSPGRLVLFDVHSDPASAKQKSVAIRLTWFLSGTPTNNEIAATMQEIEQLLKDKGCIIR